MYRFKQIILLIGDFSALYMGLFLAIFIRRQQLLAPETVELISPMIQLFLLGAIIIFIVGLYDVTRAQNNWKFFQKIIISAFAWVVVGIIYFYINPHATTSPKTILLLTALCGFGLMAIWRYLHNRFLSTVILKTKMAFAGITPETVDLIKTITREPQRGYEIIGIITGENEIVPEELKNLPQGATLSELEQITKQTVQLIVAAPHLTADQNLLKELYSGLFKHLTIRNLAKFYEEIFERIPPFTFSEGWFLTNFNEQEKKIYDRFRILTDYVTSAVIGVFFIITWPVIALAIKTTSRGPIFFRQNRIGRNGQEFILYKYRTMKVLAQDGSAEITGPQFAAKGDDRITAVGKFLRKTRLDEIPQFINVLKGQMAIIGPRPERPEFVSQLIDVMPFYSLRHLIKPGITGWAQLHSDYYGTLNENLRKLEYDLFYIKNRGLWLDLSIVLRTFNIILGMRGR